MFLQPKKTKYKKIQKGSLKRYNFRRQDLLDNIYRLRAQESGLISAKQLESARQAITRKLKKQGKLWIKIFPGLPITKKPNETRMGKGKGTVQYWVARVTGGTILFELTSISQKKALAAFHTGSRKLSIKTKIIKKRS